MIQKTKTTKTSTAWGKPLPKGKEVGYTYKWDAFEGFEELEEAKETLSNKQQVKVKNRERSVKARQEAMAAALIAAGYPKPNVENDEQFRLKKQYELIVVNLIQKAKKAGQELTEDDVQDEARTKASELMGIEWEDDDDE